VLLDDPNNLRIQHGLLFLESIKRLDLLLEHKCGQIRQRDTIQPGAPSWVSSFFATAVPQLRRKE
jgi:hypothetical protein